MLTADVSGSVGTVKRHWGAAHIILKLVVLASLLGNIYLVGLLRHSPGSFDQLRAGGTAAFPGLVTKASERSISIKTDDGTKTIQLAADTPFALFPKDYQTLIPIGLPSSRDDIVVGSTEASVSAQLPYLKTPQALRVNLVRSDTLTGKVAELKDNQLTYKAFAASGAKDETRQFAAGVTFAKLEADGTMAPATKDDVKKDMGMYAYLSGSATDSSAEIVKLVVAAFSAPTPTE